MGRLVTEKGAKGERSSIYSRIRFKTVSDGGIHKALLQTLAFVQRSRRNKRCLRCLFVRLIERVGSKVFPRGGGICKEQIWRQVVVEHLINGYLEQMYITRITANFAPIDLLTVFKGFDLTRNRGPEHVRVEVHQLVDERLLPDPVRADEDEGLAAEGRHLLHGLVKDELGLVKVLQVKRRTLEKTFLKICIFGLLLPSFF